MTPEIQSDLSMISDPALASASGSDPWRGKKKWLAQYQWQKGLCAICGKPTPVGLMTRDHITPRSKGGGTQWDNIQLACEPCNSAKGDTIPVVGFRKCNVCNERVTLTRYLHCNNDECPRTYTAMIAVPSQGQNDGTKRSGGQ